VFPGGGARSLARRSPPLADFMLHRTVPLPPSFVRSRSCSHLFRQAWEVSFVCGWGMFISPLCCVFRVVGLVTGDGRWFSPAILGVGVDDTHLVIQVHLGSGSTAPGLAAVSMLWGSSSASVGGWSSAIGHGGWRCFSFVSCPWWIGL
jgi:hypothetical protein